MAVALEQRAAVDLPARGDITTAVVTPDDRLFVALAGSSPAGALGGLYLSDDRGRTWHALGNGTRLAKGVSAVTVTTEGRILAAPQAAAGGGLLCSADGGRTWARRCG